MAFDPTIQLGHLITAATIGAAAVGAHYTLKTRMDGLDRALDAFRSEMRELGARLAKHEESIASLAGSVQRIIGRMEGRQGPVDRRTFNNE